MNIEKIQLSDLHEAKRNVRIHSQKQIDEICRSLDQFKQFRAIVCDENHEILIGNGLYLAMRQHGDTEAYCYVMEGLTEHEKMKLMLADNKIFSLGVEDLDAFEQIVADLDRDFDIPGYDDSLLETLTLDFKEADEFMSGYGIVDMDTKAGMNKAAEKYREEESEFANSAVEIKPVAPNSPLQTPPSVQNAPDHIGAGKTGNAAETPRETLERRFIVCPKCGERIWL